MTLWVRGPMLSVVLASGCGRVGFDVGAADAPRADSAVPPGAVLHLPFTEAPVGGAVQDVAASHTVSCSPCPTLVPGIRGNAYSFAPSREHNLQVPFTSDLDPSAGFTIAIWVRIAELPMQAFTAFLAKPAGSVAANSYGLYVAQDGTVLFHTGDPVMTDNISGSTLPIGEWHHLAMTWDGVTKRGYFDGVPDGARAVTIGNDSSPVVVGADLNSGTPAYGMNGELDEVLVWNRALAPTEIEQLAEP